MKYVHVSNVQSFHFHYDSNDQKEIRINFINNVRSNSYMFVQMTDKELLAIFEQNNKYKKLQAKLDAMQQELKELRDAIMFAPGGAIFQEAKASFQGYAD